VGIHQSCHDFVLPTLGLIACRLEGEVGSRYESGKVILEKVYLGKGWFSGEDKAVKDCRRC